MKIIIIIFLIAATKVLAGGFDTLSPEGENLALAEFLVNNPDSCSTINKNILSNSFINQAGICERLMNYIKQQKFNQGYVIEENSIGAVDFSTKRGNRSFYLVNGIKLRSKLTKDILWFFFDNSSYDEKWKLWYYDFCNPVKELPPDGRDKIPCNKD
jgi:hypothetical protein